MPTANLPDTSSGYTSVHHCVLCEAPLVGEARTREHLIPASLGGRRRTSMALCRRCNSTTGHKWDAELELQLRPEAQFVFPSGHPLGPMPRRVVDSTGQRLVLEAGLRGGAVEPQTHVEKKADGLHVSISARTRKRALQELKRLVKAGLVPADREEEFIASIEVGEVTIPVEFVEAGRFGGPVVWKSMLKTMVTTGLVGGLTWMDMLSAVLLMRDSGPGGPSLIFRDSPVRYSGSVEIPTWRHCVHVETDIEEHLVWGYVEYFGTYCAIARIGKCYMGRPVSSTYCVDPVTGADLTRKVQVDLAAAKALISEADAAPARRPDIVREQLPDHRPLINACLQLRGGEQTLEITVRSLPEEEFLRQKTANAHGPGNKGG